MTLVVDIVDAWPNPMTTYEKLCNKSIAITNGSITFSNLLIKIERGVNVSFQAASIEIGFAPSLGANPRKKLFL